MARNIKDKVAFVTGGFGGFGQEFTHALLKNNARGITLLDIQTEDEKFKKQLCKYGDDKVLCLCGDASRQDVIKDALDNTIDKFGNLDIVVNNAGIINEKNWEKTLNLNVMGLMRSSYLAMKLMSECKSGKHGYIVNIASILGLAPIPALAAYSTTKAAVLSMSQTYAHDYYCNKYCVKVLTICPGFSKTHLFDHMSLDKDLGNEQIKEVAVSSMQSAKTVSDALICALEDGHNGSVWLSQFGCNEKIDYPSMTMRELRDLTGMLI